MNLSNLLSILFLKLYLGLVGQFEFAVSLKAKTQNIRVGDVEAI